MISAMMQGDLFEFARGRGGPTGRAAEALETGRSRLLVTGLVISMAFMALGWRVVDLTLFADRAEPRLAHSVNPQAPVQERADIVDRNGIVVATSLPAVSLYADPKHVLDVQETADKLVRVLPDLDRERLEKRLSSRGRFVFCVITTQCSSSYGGASGVSYSTMIVNRSWNFGKSVRTRKPCSAFFG